MDASTISLSLLITLDVPRTWSEAVAVARDAGEAMALSGIAVSAADCVISTRGTLDVVAEEGEPHEGAAASLVELLAGLLDGQDAPPKLRTLIVETRLRQPLLGAFTQALAAFEPADRVGAIAGLAARGIQLRAEASTSSTPPLPFRRSSPRSPAAAAAGSSRRSAPSQALRSATLAAQRALPRAWPARGDLKMAAVLVVAGAAAIGATLWAYRGHPLPTPAPEIVDTSYASLGDGTPERAAEAATDVSSAAPVATDGPRSTVDEVVSPASAAAPGASIATLAPESAAHAAVARSAQVPPAAAPTALGPDSPARVAPTPRASAPGTTTTAAQSRGAQADDAPAAPPHVERAAVAPAPVPPAPVTPAPAARAQVPVSPAAARAAAPEVAAVVPPRVAPTVIPPPGRVPSGVAAAPVATAGTVNQPESRGADSARPAAGVSFLGARRKDAEPLLATPSLPATASTAPAPRRAPPSAAPSSSVAVAVADAGPSSVELDTVFDMSAADVVPPVFVRRQLADVVAHAGSAAAYLVLVVSQTGQVEQVRLEPPTAQVRDRLLLPAAKAWQFTPATKDGRPVRYRLRVPVPAAQ